MTRYAIDYNKCIWCSLCTENCHTGSITMSHDYDHSVYDRAQRWSTSSWIRREQQDPLPPRRPASSSGWWVEAKEEKPRPTKPPATKERTRDQVT